MLKVIIGISNIANIYFVRQKQALGLGHAIWCARKFIGNEPFAVLLGDMIIESNPPCFKQLIQIYGHRQSSVIGVESRRKTQTAPSLEYRHHRKIYFRTNHFRFCYIGGTKGF